MPFSIISSDTHCQPLYFHVFQNSKHKKLIRKIDTKIFDLYRRKFGRIFIFFRIYFVFQIFSPEMFLSFTLNSVLRFYNACEFVFRLLCFHFHLFCFSPVKRFFQFLLKARFYASRTRFLLVPCFSFQLLSRVMFFSFFS